ncbi:glycosyltransferase [Arachnia propionica]|uniref:Glycosyltransferase n=1 Tax=Arachnia propionica TaxID=1750 RepID=A0A3P1WT16_9ACTN|nr:glycosyltransferase [Arachnia propionica]RRD49038.1 glycosyltransferase [Arachnia propionica]
MDNESRLIRMARSISAITPKVQVRLVGMQVDERSGLQPLEPGIVVDRVGDAKPKQDTLASRFQKVGGWFREVYRAYRDEDLAVVAAHAVWALPVAWALARRAGVPLVYNPHELETRTPTMVGVKRFLAERIEARFIRRCRLVSAVNDEIADWYAKRYRIDRPVVVCNFPSERTQGPARPLRNELGLDEDELLFVHTGHLIAGRNIPLILEEFERAAKHHLLFVGGGDLEPAVQEAASRLRFIHHMPPVPPDDVVSVVKGADLALSLIETTAQSYAWSSPNKLFEALSAGTPPVCSDLPEARRRVGQEAPQLILRDPRSQLGPLLESLDRPTALEIRRSLKPLPTWEQGVQPLVTEYQALLVR